MLVDVPSEPAVAPVDDPPPATPADAATDADGAGAVRSSRAAGLTPNVVVGLGFAIVGLRIGLVPLHDNSFFTHLATGRLILDEGSIPRHDPYSFTAHGDAWTVQSWGASVVYALVERAAGLRGIIAMVGVLTTAIALLTWRLTKPAEQLVGRVALAAMVVAIGAGYWVERPLLFGLVFLLAVLFAAEGRLDPRWLVPVMWLWVNMHGSFPLGLAAVGLMAVGRLLDRQPAGVELRALAWAVLGTILGGINPLGPRLLVFPLELLNRREAFAQVIEWQPPAWSSWGERFFAVQLVVALAVLLLRRRSWRTALPLLAFGAASLASMRNIPQASLVLVPGMAAGLAGLGSISGERPSRILRPAAAALVALGVLIAAVGLSGPETDLRDYPVEAVTWLHDHDQLTVRSRVVTRDFVGNYLEVRYGPDEVRTYVDDRVDMYPLPVIKDYTTLIDPDGNYAAVLRRARATAVIWDHDSDFGRWLDQSPDWRIAFRDDLWIVAVPARTAR